MARGGVSFELERFGWLGEGSILEVAGRWRATRARRLGPAVLAVQAGERRRLSATFVTGEARAHPEPTLWRAEFASDGGAAGGFELEVGSNLVIELPAPEGSAPLGGRVGSAGADPVVLELEAARRQIEAGDDEIERLRDELMELRRRSFDLAQTQEFLRLAQATAEAERKAVQAARQDGAARRAAEPPADDGGTPALAELGELRTEVERLRDEVAAAGREAERARDELLKVRALAGAAGEEALRRERVVEEQRAAAAAELERLREASAARPSVAAIAEPVAPVPVDPPKPNGARAADPPALLSDGSARSIPVPDHPTQPIVPAPVDHPIAAGPTGPVVPTAAADTAALPQPAGSSASKPGSRVAVEIPAKKPGVRAAGTAPVPPPRRRGTAARRRDRPVVVAQRTAPAPRRYAQRPPTGSPALRAIAAVLLLLLAIVLVAVLVIVA